MVGQVMTEALRKIPPYCHFVHLMYFNNMKVMEVIYKNSNQFAIHSFCDLFNDAISSSNTGLCSGE
jgi:hypothetical protein